MSKDYQFYDRVVFPTCEFSAVQTATHHLGFIGFTLIHTTGHGPFAGFTTTDPEYHQKPHGDGGMAG